MQKGEKERERGKGEKRWDREQKRHTHIFSQHLINYEDPPPDLYIRKWGKKKCRSLSLAPPAQAGIGTGCSEHIAVRAEADSLTPCFTALTHVLSL